MSKSKRLNLFIAFLLILIIGRFVVVGLPKILFNHISSDGDESAYLALGLALLEDGVLSDGTRPPLYSLLLTPFAERDWSYFTNAKVVTLGMGVLTILITFWVGLRLFGWPTALLAAFLLAANKEFHVRSTTVYADVLLALVMIGAWYYLIKSVESWKNCIWAGVFVGLSFLTKGSAPVLLAAWGGMVLFHYRLAIFRQFQLLLTPLFFVIISLPLLIYNANTFGSPTYNFATQHIMWMDRLEQINTADPADLPTAATYFATHTSTDMVARVQKGLRRLNPVISRSVIPSRSFEPAWLGPVLGILAGGILIFLLFFRRQALARYLIKNQNPLLFTFFLYALFYPFFTWYVAGSSAETRFVVPLLAPLYLLLADVVVTLVLPPRSPTRGRKEAGSPLWGVRGALDTHNFKGSPYLNSIVFTAYRVGLGIAVIWGVWWLIQTAWVDRWALFINPYQADREANLEEERIVRWLADDNPTEAALITFGPSKSLPIWKFPYRFTVERLPVEIDAWPAMEAYVRIHRPAYIILDEDTVRRRRQALSGYFQYGRDPDLVSIDALPPGWALAHLYPQLPCRWCIFSPVETETTSPVATFANGIELIDWRLSQTQPNASAAVATQSSLTIHNSPLQRVILTWRAQISLDKDYTFFVHLTAPDGFVKAQQDQQPFAGTRPTSHWQSGDLFADRYDLALNESVTSGDYLLLAGMYDPTTGERVGLIEGSNGPGPNTVLLATVTVE